VTVIVEYTNGQTVGFSVEMTIHDESGIAVCYPKIEYSELDALSSLAIKIIGAIIYVLSCPLRPPRMEFNAVVTIVDPCYVPLEAKQEVLLLISTQLERSREECVVERFAC